MKKKLVLSLAAFVLLVVFAITFSAYQKDKRYSSAIDAFSNGDYAEAEKIFSALSDYKEAKDYVFECKYQGAIADLDNGNYESALEIFEGLGGYKDAQSYIDTALFERKYSLLNSENGLNSMSFSDTLLTSPDGIESILKSVMYRTWYDYDTGEELQFDTFRLNGNFYGVKEAAYIDGNICLRCYYVSDPDEILAVATETDYFEYIDAETDRLTICRNDDGNFSSKIYFSILPQEYDELVAQDDEVFAKQPNYSDETVIENTFSAFKNKIRSYYSGASTLYHTSSYSDAYVVYDPETQTYTCTMTAKYSTNAFDFWGTSTQTYYVTAQFLDTGSNLTMVNFSAN